MMLTRLMGKFVASLLVVSVVSTLAVTSQSRAQPAEPTNGPRRVDPSWHALINARVVTSPGSVIERATLVFRNGVIQSVAPNAQPPAGARIWDASGLTIYPGFIEPFAPVDAPKPEASNPGRHWNEHVMAERSALDGPGLDAEARKKLRAEGFVVAAIAPKDGVVRGSGAVVTLGERPESSDEPAPVLTRRAFHTISIDPPRGSDERYPSSKMGAIALVRQTLADVPWYERALAASNAEPAKFERPKPSDTAAALAGETALLFDVSHEQDVLRSAKIAKEFGRSAMIVGCGTELRRLDAIAAAGLPIILPLAFAEKPGVEAMAERESVGLRELMLWEASPTNPLRLERAGVKVALTSAKLPKGQEFAANVREAIRAGLSEEQALAMLTTRPAEMLGLSRLLGSIEPGKKASFSVVKGSIFEKDREVRDVWIDGVRHEVSPTPKVDLEGSWKVVFVPAGASGARVEGVLKIKKKNTISFERATTQADRDREAADKAKKEARDNADADAEAEAPEKVEDPADAPKDQPAPEADLKNAATSEDKKDDTRTFKARAVSLEENRIDFTLDGEALGTEGPVLLSAVIEDAMSGLGSGSALALTWTASREAEDAGAKDKKADEDDKDKPDPIRYEGIPERFGLPFGPFAFDEPPAQRDIVVTGATIWTSGKDRTVENATLVVQGGKIKGVFKGAIPGGAPANAIVIDANGKHITPGLIDCHSHTGIMGGVNEGTQACTSEVRIADVIDPDAINFYRQLAGGLTAANQLHGSANPIGGQNSVVKLRWGCGAPDDMRVEGAIEGIKFALGENVKQSNWGERFRDRYPQTRMGVEAYIVDRFTAAREYGESWKKWKSLSASDQGKGVPPRRDLELEALAEILAHERLVHCHSYRQDEILMLCRVAKDFGFKIGTFQHVLEGYKVAEAMREQSLGGSAFSDWWGYKWEVFDAIPYAGAIMHDAGVVVSFNSDSDELARRMNTEAGKAVKYGGLDPHDALQFVTLNPAKQLMAEARIGSLEPGKDADFAIWSGDPLSTLSRCEATYIDGREYFSLARDAELRKKNAETRSRILRKLLDKPASERPSSEGQDNPKPRAPGEQVDAAPTAIVGWLNDSRSGIGGGRGFGLVPIGSGSIEESRELARCRALEEQFHWMIQNGIDPARARCGDCGCSEHAALMGQ